MWHESVEFLEALLKGGMRHEKYVQWDLVQAICVAHTMVGMYNDLCQIGNLVLQLSLCGFIA